MTEFAQVGARTRARALAMAAAEEDTVTGSTRKRKSENGAIVARIELRSGKNWRGAVITPENSVSVSMPAAVEATVTISSRKRKSESDGIAPRIELRSGKNRRGVVITPENSVSMPAAVEATVPGSFRKRKSENDAIVRRFELRNGKNRRGVTITPENSVSVCPAEDAGQRCGSLGSSDRCCASCCSSNGSSDRRIEKYADLEDESVGEETSVYYSCRERRETTPSSELRAEFSGELDSMERQAPEANSRRRSTAERTPTEAELEEFFSEAEKKIQKQFADKYNYDIAKDKPLQGRYEWIRLNP